MTKLTTEEQIDRLLDRLPSQRIKRLEAETAALRADTGGKYKAPRRSKRWFWKASNTQESDG